MRNTYCLFKGQLLRAAPYFDDYVGSPHYVIALADPREGRSVFNVVVNSASTAATAAGDTRVYSYFDLAFDDPICATLAGLTPGLYTKGFPKLDYWQDRSLLDLRRMRPVPYRDEAGDRFDINDQIDDVLGIDESKPFERVPYFGGRPEPQDRKFWTPAAPVTVYGFGFLFKPAEDGLHETHMNQGNPRNGGHARENGVFQDGAVIVQKGDKFAAIFTAFQSQWLPTDATGYPTADAKPLPDLLV